MPTAKVEPEAGRQATVAAPSCSSVPPGAVWVTTAPAAEVAAAEMLAWAATLGGWAS